MKSPKGPKGKYAWTVKVGEKGQFVIPKEARDIFDIHPGDSLILLGDEKQGLAIPPKGILTKLMATIFRGSVPEEEDGE
jgi:AbrB family looped-hinge helix DNA binding protein